MKKNYYVPATEVVAFVGESMIMAGSPGAEIANPGDAIPEGPGTGA